MENIPTDILASAIKISNWMKQNGHDRWELLGICSINHAVDLMKAQEKIQRLESINDKIADHLQLG